MKKHIKAAFLTLSDHVFGMESTNMEIFDTLIEPIIRAVMEGFNGKS